MCGECDELDKKIEHFRSISTRITDQETIEGHAASSVSRRELRFTLIRKSQVIRTRAWNVGVLRRSGACRHAKLN
jgi:hypothetical protein